jgi:hypothetical protein
MKKSRTLLAGVAAIAGLVAFAAPAQAAPPQATPQDPVYLAGQKEDYKGPLPIVPSPPKPNVDLKAAGDDGYCDFPVKIVQAAIKLPVQTPGPVEGSTVYTFTGFGSATVTNMNTNKTLTFNISGPGSVTVFNDNSFKIDAHGPNLLYTTVANSYQPKPGESEVPQLAYTTGHVKVSVAGDGTTTTYTLNGKSTDVCPLLA